MDSASLCRLLILQTWQVTLVAVGVWCVTRLYCRQRPFMAHLLWAMVLIKAVVPPVMLSSVGLFAWSPARETVFQSIVDARLDTDTVWHVEVTQDVARSLVTRAAADDWLNTFSLRDAVMATWFAVACLLLLTTVWRCMIFRSGLSNKCRATDEFDAVWQRVRKRLAMRSSVRLRMVDAEVGPLVCGTWRPWIVLPRKVVDRLTEEQVEALLVHEALHIKRGDLYWAWLQVLATCIFWFHPLVWLASRKLTAESERCCDEATLAALHCQPADYARSLLQVLEFKHQLHSVAAWPGVRPVDITRERLERIMRLGQGCRQQATRGQWCMFGLCLLLVLPGGSTILSQELLPLLPQPAPLPRAENVSASGEPTAALQTERLPEEPQIVIETRLISVSKERLEKCNWTWQQASVVEDELPLNASNMHASTGTDLCKFLQVSATPCPTFTVLLSSQDRADKLLKEITADRKSNVLQAPKLTAFAGQVAWISQEVAHPFVTKVQPTGQPVVELATDGVEIGMRGRVVDSDNVELTIQWYQKWIDEVGTFQLASHKIQLPQQQNRRLSTQVRLHKNQTLCMTGGTSVAKEKDIVRLMMISARQIDPAWLKAMPPVSDKSQFKMQGPLLQPGGKHEHPTVDDVANVVGRVRESGLNRDDEMVLKPLEHQVFEARFIPLIGDAKLHRYTYQFTYGPKNVPVSQRKSVYGRTICL